MKLKNGAGAWELEIKYPEWGRYLLVAEDQAGGHRAGRTLYIDWPGWAGRGQKEQGAGATVLAFAPDKPEYAPGETVTLTIPTPQKGRGLVSLESGSRVLRTEWIEVKGQETRFSFTATPEMAPNIYVHVTLLQPHAQTANDLPIRLYGVAPIKVVSPETHLLPVIEAAEVLPPEASSTIRVRESSGRPMTYTLALVDEGLLGLTRFQTPDPWDYFYAREALAVRTWDLYDYVVGAFGAAMERMLAIGGDEAGVSAKGRRANRFPPMVRFLGPFRLAARATGTHQVQIPQYVGAVRVMVVAGREGAFGAAEKSVFVRRPLMLLATLPRVLGPEESVALPVSVFALEPSVKDVALAVSTTGPLEVVAEASKTATFKEVGDQVVDLPPARQAGARRRERERQRDVGRPEGSPEDRARRAELHRARDRRRGRHAQARRELDARRRAARARGHQPRDARGLARPADRPRPAARVPDRLPARLPGADRVGGLPAARSSGKLLELSPERQARSETNVKAALERLRRFQATNGGFGYWPGDDDSNDWATNYAGHFALEAQKAGYLPPVGLVDQWTAFQRRRARAWVAGEGQAELTQAYRLFTLALADAPELGAMNQLRERASLPGGREVAARRGLPARRPAGGGARARHRRAAGDPVLPGARRHLRVGPARQGDGARGGGAARPLRARRAAREEPLRIALDERVALDPRDRVRAARALEGRRRREGRGEDGLLVRVGRGRGNRRELGLAGRGAEARDRQGRGAEARGAQHRQRHALPAAHPLGPAAGRSRDRWQQRPRARGLLPDRPTTSRSSPRASPRAPTSRWW